MRYQPLSPCLLLLIICLTSVSSFQVRHSQQHRPAIQHTSTPIIDSSLSPIRQQSLTAPQRRAPSSTQLHSVAGLAVLDAFFKSSPFTAAALTCGFKASAADAVAQKRSSSSNDDENNNNKPVSFEWKRNIAFTLYGAIYQGLAQELIYNHVYPSLFGAAVSVRSVAMKVAFDLLIQTTLVTLPIAYFTKAIVYRYSMKEAMRRYRNDIFQHGLLKKYFALWGPVQCVTFGFIPQHYRVSFVACISFFWLIILSTISSKPQQAQAAVEESPAVETETVTEVSNKHRLKRRLVGAAA